MSNWQDSILSSKDFLITVIKTIDKSENKVGIVTDNKGRIQGMITDGDVRRAIMKSGNMDISADEIMNRNFTSVKYDEDKSSIKEIMKRKHLRHIPIVNDELQIIDLWTLDEFYTDTTMENWVILMAGGEGVRLRPMTENCPKPMLKIGGKPILETIISMFVKSGFNNFYISVNYKAEMIENYFGDGERFNATIRYLREDKRLGTAGALCLLPEKPKKPFFVMNGDLLTDVNYNELLKFHKENSNEATMCVREYKIEVPYGVVHVADEKIINVDEKPIHKFFVNAGIYLLNPNVLKLVPKNCMFDMTELFYRVIKKGKKTSAFPVFEYWLDIGKEEDFQRGNGDYNNIFINTIK